MNEKTPRRLFAEDLPNFNPNTIGDADKEFKGAAAPQVTQKGKTRAQLRKQGLTEKQIDNILKDAQIPKDIKGSPHQGVKTDQEGNPILSIAKGGMVKKKTKKKKSKMAGRLAKRGYGAARK
tara:strand:- start:261 stop:626 length:366 start_codon:yes stop_codon:yes gene_type:complete